MSSTRGGVPAAGRRRSLRFILPVAILSALALLVLGGSGYYSARGSRLCGDCHEIRRHVEVWEASTHRAVPCHECHGGFLSADLQIHLRNLGRVGRRFWGGLPERVRLTDAHVDALLESCRGCHRQEYAEWQAGPHAVRYERIFLDEQHNQRRLLTDDCLRCHGAFFEGGIRDLVEPLDTQGPWRLIPAVMGQRPAVSCMSCHRIHRQGEPLGLLPPRAEIEGREQEVHRPSLAFYDRRARLSVAAGELPLPPMNAQGRTVRLSPDTRQALCYQCHAPLAGFEVGSGDDRTGIGVHEGISCQTCHSRHRQETRASCAGCHPRHSNCGLDVEAMDTTFRSPESPHDVHFVTCRDCHPSGVPDSRAQSAADEETRL